jgi:hypothetical protein
VRPSGDATADLTRVYLAEFPNVLVITADYALGDDIDMVQADTTSGAITVTLPLSPKNQRAVRIRKTTSNANTLTVNGNGNLIDGVLSSWGTGATVDLVEFHLEFIGGSGWWSR